MEKSFTEKELHIAAHTVGINLYHAIQSKRKKDKKLPKEFYRNYFAANREGEDWKVLISMEDKGLAERFPTQLMSLVYFGLTDKGISKFREQFKSAVSLEHKSNRDDEVKP